jgi:transposase
MSGPPRRNHTPAFKAKSVDCCHQGRPTCTPINHIAEGAGLEDGAADVFGPGGGKGAAPPAVDVKSLHAKIGELTLDNDFLEGALNKAGVLSAKR